jgi:hypothetical protein
MCRGSYEQRDASDESGHEVRGLASVGDMKCDEILDN